MASKEEIIVAFEPYGTLLSMESITQKLADHIYEKAQTVSSTWRKYQLEYTWRLNSMGRYKPFSAVMLYSLEHALREAGLTLNQPSFDKVMAFADHHLSVFPDVLEGLAKLEKMHNTTSVIFSNGTDAMVSASLRNSLSSYAHFFKHIVTVEETRRYKPAPEVYEMLARKVGKAEEVGKMWLVSENPVDIVGARAVGMQAVWVDRGGSGWFGWADRLLEGEEGRPTAVVRGLPEIADVVKRHGYSLQRRSLDTH